MAAHVFVSTENTSDPLAAGLIERLVGVGFNVTTSPLNPAFGEDPRWPDWYASGCREALEAADIFVAVVTPGCECSTWMGFEFDRAGWVHRGTGKPLLFVLKTDDEPLPPGFRRYEEAATRLPVNLDEAVRVLTTASAAALPADAAAGGSPRVLCTVGGLVGETRACVAVYGDDLDPDDVTAVLGCPPTSCHRRGDRRGHRSPPAKRGAWFLEVQAKAPEGPEELVTRLVNKLPDDEATWTRLSEQFEVQVRIGIFLTGWNQGFDLSPGLIARIGRIRATLVFDIYAGDADEAVAGEDGSPAGS